jgi:isoquinoline 1-oxidoreductase subunit beta
MTTTTLHHNRRNFLKITATVGGGMMLGFSWFKAYGETGGADIVSDFIELNGYLKIAPDASGKGSIVTIMSPNPEVGQNVKTSMPMIVAEELGVNWKDVVVEQAPLNTAVFKRQVAGGSQSIRQTWTTLRTAGATARHLLVEAAAQQWGVDPSECTAADSLVRHASSGRTATFGSLAALAATLPPPAVEAVKLKDPSEFTLIGTDQGNVDMEPILTGKPIFGMDQKVPGMLYSTALRPPAFGKKLKSFDDKAAKAVNGVVQVFRFANDKVAVVGTSTWAAIKGKKALSAIWEDDGDLESTASQSEAMRKKLDEPADRPSRSDGDVKAAFAAADKVIERVYEAPFLPHNPMEPGNFFANVMEDRVELSGPIQTPERSRKEVSDLLKRDESTISIGLTRMGGGFGRRLRGDFVVEAAEISSLAKAPVMHVYTREDDMTAGIYRPACTYKFRAGIKDGQLTGYHLTGAGMNMGSTVRENNFPAGAVENYLVESHNLPSKVTTGPWRAPVTNFLATAEQSFLDEVAEALGQDAVQFRLDLFNRAKTNPVGSVDYDVDKSIGVIKLAAEKANWGKAPVGTHQGFSAYYSHNTYVAEVAEVEMNGRKPVVKKVVCAVDCGIVINPLAAINQAEGGVIDGIGHALYGEFSFENGQPQQENFDKFRLIRMGEQPKVDVHFVPSNNDPTGLGEPTLPPAGAAVANAFFRATGERVYNQPFVKGVKGLG